MQSLVETGEFESISIDATMRVCMTVLGQTSWRARKEERDQAAFDDGSSLRKVLTVRGLSGAVLSLTAVPAENVPTMANTLQNCLPQRGRDQVKHISSDDPSSAMHQALKQVFPNMQMLCLDPVHLAIVYEYSTWKRRASMTHVKSKTSLIVIQLVISMI